MSVVCGIDFGTSNSTLTLADAHGVHPVVVDPVNRLPQAIPTIFFFDEDGLSSYGSQAVSDYLDADHSGRLLQSIKRHLPSSGFSGTLIAERFRSVEDLIAGFLEHLRFLAEKAAGEPVTRVVLGRPAVFHPNAKQDQLAQDRLERAASMAGFVDIAFQIEPMAAARAFERDLTDDVRCLVGDLGGGTSDFTLVQLGASRIGKSRAKDVLGSHGIAIAGNDLDARLVWRKVMPHFGVRARYKVDQVWTPVPTYMHHTACRWQHLCLANTDENARFLDRMVRSSNDRVGLDRLRRLIQDQHSWTFFKAVEGIKLSLSTREIAELDYRHDGLEFFESVSRAEFEEAIQREITKLEDTIDDLIDQSGMGWEDVDVVFLTGGTSLVPRVRRVFEERFPGRIVDHDTFTSVGIGLAIEARERFLGC
jgi:hypothetical chaperone protein